MKQLTVRQRAGEVAMLSGLSGAAAMAAVHWIVGQYGDVDTLRVQLASNVWSPYVLLASIILSGMVIMPVAPALMLTGALLQTKGLILGFVGLYGACWGGFLIGRWLKRDNTTPTENKWIAKMLSIAKTHTFWVSIGLRMIPGLPFALQNMTLGASGGSAVAYGTGSIFGTAFAAALFVMAGYGSAEILVKMHQQLSIAWPVALAAAAAGAWVRFGPSNPKAA